MSATQYKSFRTERRKLNSLNTPQPPTTSNPVNESHDRRMVSVGPQSSSPSSFKHSENTVDISHSVFYSSECRATFVNLMQKFELLLHQYKTEFSTKSCPFFSDNGGGFEIVKHNSNRLLRADDQLCRSNYRMSADLVSVNRSRSVVSSAVTPLAAAPSSAMPSVVALSLGAEGGVVECPLLSKPPHLKSHSDGDTLFFTLNRPPRGRIKIKGIALFP